MDFGESEKPEIVNLDRNCIIFSEGEENNASFYIVKKGRINLISSLDLPLPSTELHPGDLFGLIETLSNKNRLMTAVAKEQSEVYKINISLLTNFVKIDPKLVLQIINHLFRNYERLSELETLFENEYPVIIEDKFFSSGNRFFRLKQFHKAYYVYSKYQFYFPNGKHIDECKTLTEKIRNSHLCDWVLNPQNENDQFIKTYKVDSLLFSEFEPGEEIFIVQSGRVKISKFIDNNEVVISIIETGNILGESNFFFKQYRTANASAIEDTKCIVATKETFSKIFSINPSIAVIILKRYAHIIWKLYRKIEVQFIDSIEGKILDILLFELQNNNYVGNEDDYIFDTETRELFAQMNLEYTEGIRILNALIEKHSDSFYIEQNRIILICDYNKLKSLAFSYKETSQKNFKNYFMGNDMESSINNTNIYNN